jgi:hypothetical protein
MPGKRAELAPRRVLGRGRYDVPGTKTRPRGAPWRREELAWGAEAIPESWLERLAMRDFIREMADALLNLSQAAS